MGIIFKNHKFKIIVSIIIYLFLLSFLGSLMELKVAMPVSAFYGVFLGLVIGSILDYKSNKNRNIKELNKNVKSLNNKFKNNTNVISELEKLNNLKISNAITNEEYLKLKEKLINKK